MGIVTEWSATALADGRVTATEACDLATRLAKVLGIPCEIDLTK